MTDNSSFQESVGFVVGTAHNGFVDAIHALGLVGLILNSDDWYSANDVISEMVRFMEFGQYDVSHAYVAQVDLQGNEIWRIGGEVSKKQLFQKMKVAHPSCFVRASVYQRYGDFSSGFRIAADYDFIMRIWSKVKVGFLPRRIVQMQMEGVSNGNPVKSYKESMAVSLIHGKGVLPAIASFYYECIKHYLIMLARIFGYRNIHKRGV
ncbi:MAG: hypothetical protein HOP34_12425 [Methylococcaceae bacterium]|nr:hypothetical protein [Methylococcaceae bacterium]